MPKENCKYWDKCYQKNEQHLQKYNHPPRSTDEAAEDDDGHKKDEKAPKRQHSADEQQKQAGAQSLNGEASTSEAEEIDTRELRNEVLGNIAGKNYMELLQKRIKLSVQSEYDDLLRTNEFIRHKFLVEMPSDFYAFWKFVCELKKDATGEQLLQHMEKQFHLQLVAPFEFLAGRFHKATIREPGDYLRHWRFFYDPPEFQTIFVRRGTGIHYGYWRDTPQDKEKLLIARNDTAKGYEFEFIAGNVFDAFTYYLENDFPATPFSAALVAQTKKAMQKYLEANDVIIEKLESVKSARSRSIVTKTFHRSGIVVPFERKTQLGYRPLIVSDAELKKIIKLFESAGKDGTDDSIKAAVIEKLQPVATAASIAVDEGDFGTALELGIDLFCSGRVELHMLVQSLLVPAYSFLNRPQFIAISKAHLEKRSRDMNLSIFRLDRT